MIVFMIIFECTMILVKSICAAKCTHVYQVDIPQFMITASLRPFFTKSGLLLM